MTSRTSVTHTRSADWRQPHNMDTCGVAQTHTRTLTDITQTALPAVWAETLEGVDPVDAGASVLTGR